MAQHFLRPIFLTNNPNLCSTSRILQSWLQLGRGNGLQGAVIGQREGDLIGWLREQEFPCQTNPMPWPDRLRPWKCGWHALRAARWARGVGADVIHCNEHDVYPFATLFRRFLNRPIVCHVRFRIAREFAKWAFGGSRCPDALLWTSHQQKSDCAEAVAGIVPEERQHVVRLGLDLNTFGTLAAGRSEQRRRWGIRPDEIVIATASPLRPRKRVEDFIRLAARVAQRDPKVVAVLAGGEIPGDEAYAERIRRMVRESGLGRRLQYVGNLEPVEPLYHAADMVVSTSEYETFGNSVCEAMACGKPVTGYVGGSVAEVVGETGLVVETGNLDDLTAATERLVQDESLRRELGSRGRQRVAEHFSPTKSFEQLRAIYVSLLS